MESLELDFPENLRRAYPEEFPLAWQASEQVITATAGRDFSALEAHSPALKGFDWNAYLRLSTIRMVRTLRLLRTSVKPGARVLDFGAYFGNFSLMLAEDGFQVSAFDSYSQYGACLEPVCKLMGERGVEIVNATEPGQLPSRLNGFDSVLLMGVVEHIPHTPRLLLEGIRNMIKPEGLLILDTPNLAYLYTRQRLARGESIFAPIQSQYWTEIPFEGHHREYTASEVEWMLSAAGFSISSFEAFNYSLYGLKTLTGTDLENYRLMESDPSMRELLLFGAIPTSPRQG